MPIKQVWDSPKGAPVKIWTDHVEESSKVQLQNIAKLPLIHKHIAARPDVHWGNGTSVGTVIATIRAIIPSAVGVDIGCGMMAMRLNLIASELPDSLGRIRTALEAMIPHGRTDNGGENDRGAWGSAPLPAANAWASLELDHRFLYLREKVPSLFGNGRAFRQGAHQLGTLGTGNHFVELCIDKEDGVWLMLHSGSRGIGNRFGTHFIDLAKEKMESWHITLDDPQLAYLPEGEELFDQYWQAVSWAQDYALANRRLMMDAALCAVSTEFPHMVWGTDQAVNCHHNYVALENHFGRNVYVTRKGAVRARQGDLGIIPGSMGARSFIVRGKGNPDSFCSCSHGAGRRMSRTAARKLFSVEDLVAQTQGVECRKDAEVIDEIPGAYKDIQQVMDNQSDLVEIVAELKQVLCVKG